MTAPRNDRARRVGRAGFASSFAVLVALAAHLAGGGAVPAIGPVIAVLALSWPVAILLIGAHPRLWRQAVVIGGAQFALHSLFAIGSSGVPLRAVDAAAGADSMAGMPGMGAPTGMTATGMTMSGTDPGMWAWHIVAFALTTAAWRWGESALQGLHDQLPQPRLLAALLPVDLIPAPPAVCLPAQRVVPRPVLLVPPPRRGPPIAA